MPDFSTSDPVTRARRIISENRYLTLATWDGVSPWASPVAYVVGDSLDFYWASLPDAAHSRNLERGGRAAIAIFDSRATYEAVDGLQAEGEVSQVGAADADEVHGLYVQRYPMYVDMPVTCLGLGRFRFYRFRPTSVYVLDDHPEGGDSRRAVDIVELRANG